MTNVVLGQAAAMRMKDSSESEQLRTVTSVALGKCAIPLTASSVQYQPYTRHAPHATR
jgi:hypothetical protein